MSLRGNTDGIQVMLDQSVITHHWRIKGGGGGGGHVPPPGRKIHYFAYEAGARGVGAIAKDKALGWQAIVHKQ